MSKLIKVSGCSKDGNIGYDNVMLPSNRIVCPQCNGAGKHVNPAIDGHGLSYSDFIEDLDFAESYFAGHYDVSCETCNGRSVIDEIDEERCKTRLSWYKGLLRHKNMLQQQSEYETEQMAELRWGA